MSSIQNLPKETLQLIIENLEKSDRQQLQYVCRSIYATVHVSLLRNIELSSALAVKKFIRSIDCNEDSSYLAAVRSLKIIDADDRTVLSEANIRKLLFRFYNLQGVELVESLNVFQDFNDDLSAEFLDCCPKLNVFKQENYRRNYPLLFKFRNIFTSMDIYDIEQFGGALKGIKHFPRLKEITGASEQLSNIQKWLPILKHVPNLESLCIEGPGGEEDQFTETFLATLSRRETDSLLKTLAQIKHLDLVYTAGFTKNSVEFVTKYLTHKEKTISLVVNFEPNWRTWQQLELCKNSFDLVQSAKHGAISYHNMTAKIAETCMPFILQNVFNTVDYRRVKIQILPMNSTLEVHVSVGNEVQVVLDLENLDNLFGIDQITIDECILTIRDYTVNANAYYEILQAIPSIKKVVLDKRSIFDFE